MFPEAYIRLGNVRLLCFPPLLTLDSTIFTGPSPNITFTLLFIISAYSAEKATLTVITT
jgi:hypothetical protein